MLIRIKYPGLNEYQKVEIEDQDMENICIDIVTWMDRVYGEIPYSRLHEVFCEKDSDDLYESMAIKLKEVIEDNVNK